MEEHLQAAGVEMLFSTECENILLEDDVCRGVIVREAGGQSRTIYADTVVIGTGRRGADCWKSSAPNTTSPTSLARWTSASGWSAATR